MSGLDHLRALAAGRRPSDDGLLGNTRCAWGGDEHLSEEAILAAFAAQPFDLAGDLLCIETGEGAAILGEGRALVADLYDGRIGRMWRVGPDLAASFQPAVHVAFDPDLRQARGDLSFRAEDHPELHAQAADPLLAAARALIEELRGEGRLRVRGFVVRAFGTPESAAALIALFTMGNGPQRQAGFSYAALGLGVGGRACTVFDPMPQREWTPRL